MQFCNDNGIEIPYFCYHPAMSTPTNCRMCLIELGFHAKDRATGDLQYDEEGNAVVMWGRKPATSCNTQMGPGMFVKTHRSSEQIKTAQQGVLEYMLVNHPLDARSAIRPRSIRCKSGPTNTALKARDSKWRKATARNA
ncbi:MAG: 2Fe-2S iron-sulfur cluster-binding protein [Bacteroidia bacterium]